MTFTAMGCPATEMIIDDIAADSNANRNRERAHRSGVGTDLDESAAHGRWQGPLARIGNIGVSGEDRPAHALQDRTMWEVFARRKFEEPLYHLGTLAADDPGLALSMRAPFTTNLPGSRWCCIPVRRRLPAFAT